jgi:hypothetical protein
MIWAYFKIPWSVPTADTGGWAYREFFKVKLRGFLKVEDSLLNCITLANGSHFRALGNIQVIFTMYNRGKGSCDHLSTPPTTIAAIHKFKSI